MSRYPSKIVIDTNVPVTANLALNPLDVSDELVECVQACIEAVKHAQKNGGVVLDDADEIFTEYRRNLSLRGQPGVGDCFMKWLHDNRWSFPDTDRVQITKIGESYSEFPVHTGLSDFDKADQKFVAVACAHSGSPVILEATDCKWWGWKAALEEVGVEVQFLSPAYVEQKYREKMGS